MQQIVSRGNSSPPSTLQPLGHQLGLELACLKIRFSDRDRWLSAESCKNPLSLCSSSPSSWHVPFLLHLFCPASLISRCRLDTDISLDWYCVRCHGPQFHSGCYFQLIDAEVLHHAGLPCHPWYFLHAPLVTSPFTVTTQSCMCANSQTTWQLKPCQLDSLYLYSVIFSFTHTNCSLHSSVLTAL